jgi:hypothetical protein
MAVALAAGLLISTPAKAATPPPAFEIFYGLDCAAGKTASRVYTGSNPGEAWVNDTFNSTKWGSAGAGQLIRRNAASIYISYASVTINWDYNQAWMSGRRTGVCMNLGYMRNNNLDWNVIPY